MTVEDFNALPLEARRFIEKQKRCLSCSKGQDLDTLYKLYLAMKNNSLFTLRIGAVGYTDKATKKRSILYPLHPADTVEATVLKLQTALRLNAVKPDAFAQIDVEAIKVKLEELAPQEEPKAPKAKKAKPEAKTEEPSDTDAAEDLV